MTVESRRPSFIHLTFCFVFLQDQKEVIVEGFSRLEN